MKTKPTYYEQLKDPRWQKKRLEIMERDEFTCTSCQNTKSTLNVHHKVPYSNDSFLWEYENDELTTLCEDCHKEISEIIKNCTSIIMGRCWFIDSAKELYNIMCQIDGNSMEELIDINELLKKYFKNGKTC